MNAGLPTDERTARLALSRVGEPGGVGIQEALVRWGAVETLQRVVRGTVAVPGAHGERFSSARLADDLRHAERVGARVLVPSDPQWPSQVGDLAVPPLCLWVLGPGDLAETTARSVALVGARSATAYGVQVAADLAAGLCDRGFTIVSGGAFGIDAAAHRGLSPSTASPSRCSPEGSTASIHRATPDSSARSPAPGRSSPSSHRGWRRSAAGSSAATASSRR